MTSDGDDTVYQNGTVYSNFPVIQMIQGTTTTTTVATSPQTGDATDALGWWLLLPGSLTAMFAIISIQKKKTA